jgi:hypothetical protein
MLQPHRYVGKLRRLLGTATGVDVPLPARINATLRERHGFTAPLTAQEIERLVDVHLPDELPGDFRIGFDGFDWARLHAEYLPGFELAWVVTSGYMGRSNPAALPSRWQRVNDRLAAAYPLDGSNFSAFWRRAGAARAGAAGAVGGPPP